MNSLNSSEKSEHSISVVDRNRTRITGVTQIISFDEYTVLLSTVCGNIEIDGEELHIDALDLEHGLAVVNGTVNGLNYFVEKRKKRMRFRSGE